MDLDRLKQLCLAFPGTTEDLKWGADLCFCIGGKMFCVTGIDHQPLSVSFKVSDEEFEEVSARKGFRPADYVARYKWVTLEDAGMIPEKELKRFVAQSYELVRSRLPKKEQKKILEGETTDHTSKKKQKKK
jgi:predicted DNA-binding protein (MmcQ/YjbR family)